MNIPHGYMQGISRRSRFRAMVGPVPNHVVVNVNFSDRLLCSGALADAYVNGGGPDCQKCAKLVKEMESES